MRAHFCLQKYVKNAHPKCVTFFAIALPRWKGGDPSPLSPLLTLALVTYRISAIRVLATRSDEGARAFPQIREFYCRGLASREFYLCHNPSKKRPQWRQSGPTKTWRQALPSVHERPIIRYNRCIRKRPPISTGLVRIAPLPLCLVRSVSVRNSPPALTSQ